ncbi:hypothetical protein COP2_044496 [Malus domestica]
MSLLVLQFTGPQHGLKKANKITALAGQPQGVNFNHHAEYVTVDPEAGRALFYYVYFDIGWTDSPVSVLPTIKRLMASGISVWMYNGDNDARVPVTSSKCSKLKFPVKTAWWLWYSDGEVEVIWLGTNG